MILVVYGTRPEYIKIKPLIEEFNRQSIPFRTLFTGQHENIAPTEADLIWEMTDDKDDNRLNSIIKNCLSIPDYYFEYVTHVLVQGDTSSVLGLALNCMHRQIKVIHLEAGLRTHDKLNPYPEEYNRILVSRIADIHLCPTKVSKNNLAHENIIKNVHVVGNTVLDNLLPYKEKCEYQNKVLVTMHRRENHKDIAYWFIELNKLALKYNDLEFLIPLHPNPNIQKYKHLLSNLTVVEPMSHDGLMEYLVKCKLVITDSGGLQEECSFFNKRCLVCRKTTERPEALQHSSELVTHFSLLKEKFNYYINNYEIEDGHCPFGDGRASEKIAFLLKNYEQDFDFR